jgi:hypothetical protein
MSVGLLPCHYHVKQQEVEGVAFLGTNDGELIFHRR